MKSSAHAPLISMADKALVYLIQGVNSYKIGVTNNLRKRMSAFKTANPHIRHVAHTELMDREEAEWMETRLHVLYAEKRIAGEWFELDTLDVFYLIELWSGKSAKRSLIGPILKSFYWLITVGSLVGLALMALVLALS